MRFRVVTPFYHHLLACRRREEKLYIKIYDSKISFPRVKGVCRRNFKSLLSSPKDLQRRPNNTLYIFICFLFLPIHLRADK